MSQWSASRSQQAARFQHPQHPAQVRTSYAGHGEARGSRRRGADDRAAQAAYTFVHVRFAPVVFWIVVGTVVILAGWSIASATYLAFRDDVLRTLIAHQAQQQFAYEDRIADCALRSTAAPAGNCSIKSSSNGSSTNCYAGRPFWNRTPPLWAAV